jgi:transcriptional regulator with XRE-family HTH domain
MSAEGLFAGGPVNPGFGAVLRHWRVRRGRTQFELAAHAGFSQRHVSFLESGRSNPSRSTVVILADALEVPVAERNQWLQSAGFAPLYSAEPLDSERLKHAVAALETVVQSHRPFPALIVDRGWNVHRANANALALFQQFMPDTVAALTVDKPLNVMQVCIEPGELRACIRNWLPFMAALVGQLKAEQARQPAASILALIQRIEADPEFQIKGRDAAGTIGSPVPTLQLACNGLQVELFTLQSTFGTVNDATLAEVRVETLFPADQASRDVLLRLDATLRG